MTDIKVYGPDGRALFTCPIREDAIVKNELMGDYYVELPFQYPYYIQFPIGSYITYDAEKFEILYDVIPEPINSSDGYNYVLRFHSVRHRLKMRLFRWLDSESEEVTFSLTANIAQYIDLVRRNFTFDAITIKIGSDVDTVVCKTINFDGLSIWDALDAITKEFEVEWELVNIAGYGHQLVIASQYETSSSTVSLKNGEILGSEPTYQKGDNSNVGTRYYIFGGTKNLPEDYYKESSGGVTNHISNKRLHLPASTGGYIDIRKDLPDAEIVEKYITLDDVYPKNEFTIVDCKGIERTIDGTPFMAVIVETDKYIDYDDIVDTAISAVFTSGALNGREFELIYNGNGNINKFEIVAISEDAGDGTLYIIPNNNLLPEVGDRFILTGVKLGADKIAEAESLLLSKGSRKVAEINRDTNVYECHTNAVYCTNNKIKLTIGQKVNLYASFFSGGYRESKIRGYERKLYNPYDAIYYVGDNAPYSKLKALESQITLSKNLQSEFKTTSQSRQEALIIKTMSAVSNIEQGGSGSVDVSIESLNETYIETTNTSTDSGKVLKVGAKTATISSADKGLATAEDVRAAINNIHVVSLIDTNTDDYISVDVAQQKVGKDTVNTFIVDAKTADITSSSKGLAKAEDVRARLAEIGGYRSADVNYLVATTTDINVTLTPNKIETRISTNGYRYVTLTIPSATADNTKDDVYIFRGYMRGQSSVNGDKAKVSVVSDASTQPLIVWKDNNVPDAITNVGYIEVRIKVFSKTLYLGEWSYYPTSAVINE